jgi:glycosyltransferase involved in cell wall biosynthesis
MITTFYPPYSFGGDGVFVHRLANMLARRGHEVEVIHCIDSYRALTKRPPAEGWPNEPGVTVHGLVSGVGRLSPLATHQTGQPWFKRRKIRAILEAKRFDVTHFHNISLIGGPGILRYGEGVKLYTCHDHWLVCPTSVLFKFGREACSRPNCLPCTMVHRRPPQFWRYSSLLPAALSHVDSFIVLSEFTRERHALLGLDLPAVLLPPGLAEAPECGEGPGQGESALPSGPFFLFAGRLEKLKGLQTVIPLFRRYPAADLVVAGDGDYAPELKRLAKGCDRIHFVGRLGPAQLRAAYARAVALLVPSITYETFGQVVIESFATRTPVIVRHLGPLPEIIAESGGGLVFRNDAELREALERLQNDRPFRDALGLAGYRAYREQWTEELHLERYLALIDDLRARKASLTPEIAVR